MCALYKIGAYVDSDKEKHIYKLRAMQDVFIPEHRHLWMARNKQSDLEKSIIRMQKVDLPIEKFAAFYPFSKDF